MGSAEVACVPSLYEGFSLPTAELMACETPLVVSRAGAIPEVVGARRPVRRPGHPGRRRRARAGARGDARRPERRARMGAAGRQRVQELFSWRAVAAADRRGVRGSDRSEYQPGEERMLTVDFDRLGLRARRPGARHGLRRRPPRLRDVPPRRRRHRLRPGRRRAGRASASCSRRCGRPARCPRAPRPTSRRATRCRCRSPTASSTGSWPPRCSSTSPPTSQAIDELVRVLRPGGTIAVTVPALAAGDGLLEALRRLPQRPGRPHPDLLRQGADRQGDRRRARRSTGKDHAHGLHSPYWWIKCAVGVKNDDHPLVKAYHRLLVWDIMQPARAPPGWPSRCSTR